MPETINIQDFLRVDLVVGEIVSAETVEGSNKLLLLKIDIGEEVRAIFSGIRKYYSPEDLEGKKCVIVANLEPRAMMGAESNGMLACTSHADESGAEVVRMVEIAGDIPNGAKLS